MFDGFFTYLVNFFKNLLLVIISVLISSAIITILWNGLVITITAFTLPTLTFWQIFGIVGIIQFIRIKI